MITKEKKEELEYVLGMYKKVELILDTWDKEDLKNRIKNIKEELKRFYEKEKKGETNRKK